MSEGKPGFSERGIYSQTERAETDEQWETSTSHGHAVIENLLHEWIEHFTEANQVDTSS